MSSRLLRCYFASPYGFAESTRQWYYEQYLPRFEGLVEIVDPWAAAVSASPDRAELLRLGDRHFAVQHFSE